MPLYRNILKQAFNITFKYKYLWFFGLFATFLGGGGEYEIIMRGLTGDVGRGFFDFCYGLKSTGIFSHNAINNIANNPSVLLIPLLIFGILLILFIFFVWLTIIAQVGIVNNASKTILSKEKVVKLGIKDGAIAGTKYFWPVLGLNAIIKIIIMIAFLIIGLPFIFSTNEANLSSSLIYVILFVVFVPLAVALALMIKYAICFTVIKGATFMNALKQGWMLFKKNWLVSIEMSFILFFINFLASLAVIFLILLIAIPFVFMAFIMTKAAAFFGFWLVAILGVLTLLVIVVLFGSALTTFQITAWTSLFIELVGKGGESKIMRLLARK